MARIFAKEIPWCLIVLAALSTTCNICVLLGNYKTADSLERIGQSTHGWSNIGLHISRSLQIELDEVMVNLSDRLLDSLNHTLHTSKILNTVVSAAAAAADHIEGSQATTAVSFLQSHMISAGGPVDVLPGLLNSAIDKMLDKLLKKAIDLLDVLLAKIKPVLEEVGKFMMKFGDKIQNVVEGFSITLDRAQKIFDRVMAAISGGGTGLEEMFYETFNLFDVSNTGYVNRQDLKDVAKLYSVSAFAGKKSDELIDKYDDTKDGRLNKKEFASLLTDPSLPNVMPVLLRQYSKRLVEMSGSVAAARQRDEIAGRVVDYLQLVVAKNLTKMEWIATTLSNASLPLEFTADIMAELALSSDEPGVLTTQDVGKVVVHEMMKLNQTHVTKAFKFLSNPKHWVEEGYHSADQAKVIERVTKWMSHSPAQAKELVEILQHPVPSPSNVAGVKDKESIMFMEIDSTADVSRMAFSLAKKNMKDYLYQRDADAEKAYTRMFATKTSRALRSHLLGKAFASDEQYDEAERAVKSGMPAAPATLAFAQWLAANASSTSERFQHICFNSSLQSSNAIDSFANQIQGMVKKIQSFIAMMKKYSTPSGIQKLETQVHDFAAHAGKDMLKVIKKKVGFFVNRSTPLLNQTIDSALDGIGDSLGHSLAHAIGTPLGKALSPALRSIMAQMLHKNGSESNQLGEVLANTLGEEVSEVSGDVLGHQLGKLLHDMINTLLEKAVSHLNQAIENVPGLSFVQSHSVEQVSFEEVLSMMNDHATLHVGAMDSDRSTRHLTEQVESALVNTQKIGSKIAQAQFSHFEDDLGKYLNEEDASDTFALSGVWIEVVEKLRSFSNILPQASKALKLARQEVSKVASHLESIFEPFQITGPKIFWEVGQTYRWIWTIYFVLYLPLTAILVFYGFWAGGFLGGPGSTLDAGDGGHGNTQISEDEKDAHYRIRACWNSCCHCIRERHDLNMCFWSCILIAQMFSLLVFLTALFFLMLGGVKEFIAAGCQQIYVLNDATLCGQTLQNIREFLSTFLVERAMDELPKTCVDDFLLTCHEIGSRMQTSAILTVVFGFVAAMMSFQMIVESSVLHTRAVSRRSLSKED